MPATEQEAPTTPTDAMSSWVDSLTPLMTDDPPAAEIKKEPANADKTPDTGVAAGAGDDAQVATDGTAGRKGGGTAKTADEPVKPAQEQATEEDKWPRTAKDWEKFRSSRKETETRLHSEVSQREAAIKELQAKLSSVQEQASKSPTEIPEVKAELDRLKKDNEEMSHRLHVLDVTQHPKFQAYFKNKVDAQVELARRIVGPELSKDIEAALALPDTAEFKEIKESRLQSVIENLSPLQQSRIGSVLNSMASIEQEREGEIALAKENSQKAKALDQQGAENKRRQLTQASEAAIGDAVKKLQDPEKGSPLFQLRDGDEAWNSAVKSRVELARSLFYGSEKLGMNDMVNAALSASAFPELMSSYRNYVKTSKEQISKLQEQVKAMTAAQPRRGESGVEAEGGDGKMRLSKEMSPMDVTQAWLKSGPWNE